MKSIYLKKRHSLRRIIGWSSCLILILLLPIVGVFLVFTNPAQAAPPLVINSFPAPLPSGQVSIPYSATLTATGGTPPYTSFTIVGALPTGLSYAAAGTAMLNISGTPTNTGNFSFIAQVTDSASVTTQQPFFITITAAPAPALTFATTSLPSASEGKSYIAAITTTGGKAPITFSVTSGALPTGLLLNTTGTISGTPSRGTAGMSSFTITATDSSTPPVTAQYNFTLTIEKGAFESTVTIDGLSVGQTKVVVGGREVARLRGGESIKLSFDLGTNQVITVDTIVPHPTNAGIRFRAESDRITVSELSSNANFTYHTEFSIEFKTSPLNITQLTSSGWYEKGYVLRTSALAEVDAMDKPGTQYRFSYWLLPSGETVRDQNLSLNVSTPGSCVPNYDTYYKLTFTSPYGKPAGGGWYKAGSEAEWSLASQEDRMSGIIGLFGGKFKAINYAGTEVMDEPKTVTIDWKPDYTMPAILIPIVLLVIIFGIYGLYRLMHRPPKPVPYAPPPYSYPPPYLYPPPPPPQPIPPPQTTVVMIEGDKQKQIPQTTREKLMEMFGELLQKYEEEIGADRQLSGPQELPEAGPSMEKKSLPAPEIIPPSMVEADYERHEEVSMCGFATKKLIRTVVDKWKQMDIKPAEIPSSGKKGETATTGRAVVWSRGIYNEWELHICTLPEGHKGTHKGSTQTVYSLTKTITEEKTYGYKQPLKPPAPHYTEGMPQLEITANQIVPEDQLPS